MKRHLALTVICILVAQLAPAAPPSAEQLLEDVRAKYAALASYADTGTMIVESKPIGATIIRQQLTFTTRFAATKQFFFEATKASGERFVIWCTGDNFHSWWSATQVHESYSPGEGANAFAMGALPTGGTALLIPPLLFQSAGLQGPLLTIQELRYEGLEALSGRRMHKMTGKVRENHWNDSVRNTTLWIDAQTLLVRKIFEDTPTGMGSAIQRATTMIEPILAPKLQRSSFEFRVPAGS